MQLKDFPKNASCDMIAGEPMPIEAGGGFATVRFNITPRMEAPEQGGEEVQVGWDYSEVNFTVDAHKGVKSCAKRAIINAAYTHDEEEALKHQVDAVTAKIVTDSTAKPKYNEFLQFRADIDTMLDAMNIQ